MQATKIGCVLAGTVIGAGFASGKEIVRFFAVYPNHILFIGLGVFLLFLLTSYLFLQLGKIIKPKSFNDITKALFGRFSVVFDVFIIICYAIISASMLAGVDSLFADAFGINFKIFSIIALLLSFLVIQKGMRGLKFVNLIIVPVILVMMFIIYGYAYFNPTGQITSVTSPNFFGFLSNMILHMSLNMLLAASILCSAQVESPKNYANIFGGIGGSLFLGISAVVVLLGVFSSHDMILSVDMPILFISKNIGNWIAIVAGIVILFGIFTTLVSTVYPLIEFGERYLPKKIYIYLIIAVFSILFKELGFSVIVDYAFPIIGGVGVIFIVYSIIYYFRNRYKIKKIELAEELD